MNDDKRVRFKPTYVLGDYVRFDRTPLISSLTKRPTSQSCLKLIIKLNGPFLVLSVGYEYLIILREDVEKFIIINCVTHDIQKEKVTYSRMSRTAERKETSFLPATKLKS